MQSVFQLQLKRRSNTPILMKILVTKSSEISLRKIDVARRQLSTAIRLWFADGDPVSIHTLACAAYEIIHVISGKNGRVHDLLYDSVVIKDEYRKQFLKLARRHANFFKHADRDYDQIIKYNTEISEDFILFSLMGIELMGLKKTYDEESFLIWRCLEKPKILSDNGRKVVSTWAGPEDLEQLIIMGKTKFFKIRLNSVRIAQ